MKVIYRKSFVKEVDKITSRNKALKELVAKAILDLKDAQSLKDIDNCKKLVGYNSLYRLKIDGYRAFFFHLTGEDELTLHYLAIRSKAYAKEMKKNLRSIDS